MDPTPYLAHLRRMDAEQRSARERRAAEVRERLPAVIELLMGLGAVRVVLFGSLLQGELHERSDVDLAVEGLPAHRYWEALSRATDALGRDVDLVRLEEAAASLSELIAAEGEVLHG